MIRPSGSDESDTCALLANTRRARLSPLGVAEEAERGEEAAEGQGSTPGDLMEDDAVADKEEELSGDEEEARAAKVRRAPRCPTQLERE